MQFDMVTNGDLLDPQKINHLDSALGMMMPSFSSIDPDTYQAVHTNLNQQRVMENIQIAQRYLKQTNLSISLTPMPGNSA